MLQETYSIKKISGLGIGVVTFLSIATVSSNTSTNSITQNMGYAYHYESAPTIMDNQGELCISSDMADSARGDIMLTQDEMPEFVPKRKKQTVNLQITSVKKHVPKFDFEEEYEEI